MNTSAIELQKIDCNCNDCKFMDRDFQLYNKWLSWHKNLEEIEFIARKKKAIETAKKNLLEAKTEEDKRSELGNLRVAEKMKWQFDKTGRINYGNCTKLNKPVSFLPNICQLETQQCFEHRKD